MRAVIQRVSQAEVVVERQVAGSIGSGLLVLLGIESDDTVEDAEWLCRKIARMRILEDETDTMNRSLQESKGEALVVSQFTLHASTRKGNRPSFIRAARPEHAEPLYGEFKQLLSMELSRPVASGVFGAMMQVRLVNDGPVTIIIDSKNRE